MSYSTRTESEYAARLIGALSKELRAQIREAEREEPGPSDIPSFQRCEGIETLPLPGDIEPMSLVILILPGRVFTAVEAARISRFEAEVGDEIRLLPVAPPGVGAVPPPPLAPYVSAPGDENDAFNMKQVATWLLIHFYLRASCDEKSVFISYRTKDGKAAAARLAAGLAERRFAVFRDENLDDDKQKLLKWGTQAQQSLTDASTATVSCSWSTRPRQSTRPGSGSRSTRPMPSSSRSSPWSSIPPA